MTVITDSSKTGIGPTASSIALASLRSAAGMPYVFTSGAGALNIGSYARTRAAYARVKSGAGYMKIGCIGDSTQAGAYALGSGTAATGNRAVSPIVYFTSALNVGDTPAVASSFFGDQNMSAIYSVTAAGYDPRITLNVGWASAGAKSAGGALLMNSTNTNALSFAPSTPVDTFDVYYAKNTGLGQFVISRTGDTSSAAIDSAGSQAVGKSTFTGALGTNALNIARNGTGGAVYIMGVDAYDSSVKSIRCFNLGWSSGKVSDWIVNAQGFDPLPGEVALGCDLYIVESGINEWLGAVSVATYQANLETLVDALLAVGDVMLSTGYPTQNSTVSLVTQKTYVDAVYTVAGARGLLVNDTWRKVANYEQANGLGYYANTIHPNKTLYEQKAYSDAACVRAICA